MILIMTLKPSMNNAMKCQYWFGLKADAPPVR